MPRKENVSDVIGSDAGSDVDPAPWSVQLMQTKQRYTRVLKSSLPVTIRIEERRNRRIRSSGGLSRESRRAPAPSVEETCSESEIPWRRRSWRLAGVRVAPVELCKADTTAGRTRTRPSTGNDGPASTLGHEACPYARIGRLARLRRGDQYGTFPVETTARRRPQRSPLEPRRCLPRTSA